MVQREGGREVWCRGREGGRCGAEREVWYREGGVVQRKVWYREGSVV